jgi:hypothetical protein
MKPRLRRVLCAAIVTTVMGSGVAATYECKAVDSLAKVYSNTSVTTEEDKSKKVCTFSVGGATSKGASAAVSDRLRQMNSQYANPVNRLELFSRDDIATSYVTTLLGAASPTGELPDPALRKLDDKQTRGALRRCFAAAAKRGELVTEQVTTNQVRCEVARASAELASQRLLTVEVEAGAMRWAFHLPLP